MDSTFEMKQVRNYLRDQMRMIKNDPFLADVANRVSARIVKWNKREHSVLICVRDLNAPETNWNSAGCRWVWTNTWGSNNYCHWRWDIWKALNDLVNNMRFPDRLSF